MRVVVVVGVALAGGCYSPHPQAGAPCDPASPSCPSGQMCVSEAGGTFCETHPAIDALLADNALAPDAAADAPGLPDGRLPDAQSVFTYTATVAECVNPAMPNPGECRTSNGSKQLVADATDSMTNQPWDAFVRFDVDGAISARTIVSAELVLTATDDAKANSNSSGAIWQVTAFDLVSLGRTTPSTIGSAPVAPAQANVTQLEVLMFTIPDGLVAANAGVYLGIISTSADGVNYWNLDGTNPPRLVVTVR